MNCNEAKNLNFQLKMRLYAQHTHKNDATLCKRPIRFEKLVIFGCRSILSSNAVIIKKKNFALFIS